MMSQLFNLQGKTALVTGGSTGIGAMIARGFARIDSVRLRPIVPRRFDNRKTRRWALTLNFRDRFQTS